MKIGQKIVCVDSSKLEHTVSELNSDVPNWIQKDKHYTIRGFNDSDFVVGVLLEEVRNPLKYFKLVNKVLEPSFKMDRFRELEEDEVESEVLTEELTTTM